MKNDVLTKLYWRHVVYHDSYFILHENTIHCYLLKLNDALVTTLDSLAMMNEKLFTLAV